MQMIYNIILFACIGNVFVWQLVNPGGLFERLPLLWKRSALLSKLLSCSSCVAGWCSIGYNIAVQDWWHIFPVAVLTMVTAKLIESKIYGKF